MSQPDLSNPVPRKFFETELGFELPDDVLGYYVEGNKIVFSVQLVDEVGCDFRIYRNLEEFPLSDEQIQILKNAGYYTEDGRLIL